MSKKPHRGQAITVRYAWSFFQYQARIPGRIFSTTRRFGRILRLPGPLNFLQFSAGAGQNRDRNRASHRHAKNFKGAPCNS